jgi:hypothetical protein
VKLITVRENTIVISNRVHYLPARRQTMAAPSGDFHILANGYKGILHLDVDASGNVAGYTEIDGPATNPTKDPIQGFWDDSEARITFQRFVKAAGGSPQNYTGFQFKADDGLFGGFGPPIDPSWVMLAGSFDAFGTGGSGAEPFFGWVARQQIPGHV